MNLIFLLLDKLNALYDILQQGVSSRTHPTVISIVPTVVCLALQHTQTYMKTFLAVDAVILFHMLPLEFVSMMSHHELSSVVCMPLGRLHTRPHYMSASLQTMLLQERLATKYADDTFP